MPFEIVRNDITNMHADAIVNTANPRPIIGAGTDSAIHAKAGPQLLEARRAIGNIERGHSAITPAFGLDAKYVIHTVTVYWRGGKHGEADILRSAYDSALALALENDCQSIAIPLMAAGSYGFPKQLALQIANEAISSFLLQHEMDIFLVVFNKDVFRLSRQLRKDVQTFVDDNYIARTSLLEYGYDAESELQEDVRRRSPNRCRNAARLRAEADELFSSVLHRAQDAEEAHVSGAAKEVAPKECMPEGSVGAMPSAPAPQSAPLTAYDNLDDLLRHRAENFPEAIMRIMNEKNLSNPTVYRRAGMDKRLFSKIISGKSHPTKSNALLIALGLQLDIAQTQELLAKAGYALTNSSRSDLVVMFFIQRGDYNVIRINEVLFDMDLPVISKCSDLLVS